MKANVKMTRKTVDYPKVDIDFLQAAIEERNDGTKETDIFRAMLRRWIENEKRNRNKEQYFSTQENR